MTKYSREVFKEQKRITVSIYLSGDEKKRVIKQLGDSAFLLLDYYYRANKGTEVLDDAKVARNIMWTKSKVSKYRRLLIEHKFIRFETARLTKDDIIVYSWRGVIDINKRIAEVKLNEHREEKYSENISDLFQK